MIGLRIILDGDNAFPDLKGTNFKMARITAVARLKQGTVQGNSTICFRIEAEDGQVLLAETTYKLFEGAAVAFRTAEERDKA